MNKKYMYGFASTVLSLFVLAESAYANNQQMYSFEGSRNLAAQQYSDQATEQYQYNDQSAQQDFQPLQSEDERSSIQHFKKRRPTSKVKRKAKVKSNAQIYVQQNEFDETGYVAAQSTGYRRQALSNRLFIDIAPIVNSGAIIGYERHFLNRFSVGPYAGMMKINKNDAENEITLAGVRGRWFVMGDADQHGLYAMFAGQYTQVKGKMTNVKIREKLGITNFGLRDESIAPEVSEFGGMAGAGYQLPISVSNDYKMLLDLAGVYSHGYDVKNEPRFQNGKESLPTTIQYQFFVNASFGLIF
ncbi:MAG: hypothetical protein ACK5WZ_02060 [Pseudobdellovibrionaceae bacterium]